MSSPIRRTNSRSSPARHTPNGFRRSQANAYHSPLRNNANTNNADSPSRLIEEFSKVYIEDEKAFRKKLDEQCDEQERLHRQALEKSLKEHEEIRHSAEIARERLQLEVERLKLERAEQERRALEKEQRQAAEAEAAARQRELEEVKRREEVLQQAAAKQREVEEAQRRIEAQKKQEAEDKAKREAERAKEEADRKAKEEAARKEREEAEAAKKAAPPVAPAVQQPQAAAAASKPATNGIQAAQPTASTPTSTTTVSGPTSNGVLVPKGVLTPMQEREAEHKRYLDLHKLLKQMRQNTLDQAKQLGIKNDLGDMRRELKKVIGQMNKVDKVANRQSMTKIKQILLQAAQMQQIMIDVTPYIVSLPPQKLRQDGGGNTQYPAILLFLLNHFAKAIMSQLSQEVARDTHAADPIGILVVTIFASPEFLFNGRSLIDVLWAKYHKVCPVLFGIYGSQKTAAGRARLGWRIDDGAEVSPQEHYDHMVGFAAGFAAITLRDFTKSKNKSPAPVHLYWTSLARIVSTPNNDQTPTHYIVLNNMLKHSVPRFIGFYGAAALAALRAACVTFPSAGGPLGPSGTGPDSTVLAVQSLPMTWQKDLNLTL